MREIKVEDNQLFVKIRNTWVLVDYTKLIDWYIELRNEVQDLKENAKQFVVLSNEVTKCFQQKKPKK